MKRRAPAGARAVTYARITNDTRKGTERAGEGVARHRKLAHSECERRDYNVVASHTDENISAAKRLKRAGYDKVIALVEAGEVDVIVVSESERIWRDIYEYGVFERIAVDHGITVVLDGEEYDPSDPDDSMMLAIKAAFGAREVKVVKRRTNNFHQERADKGMTHGRAGFGHAPGRQDETEDAEHVRECAARLIRGESKNGIAKDWNARGITSVDGNPWTAGKIGLLMSQTRLMGYRSHKGVMHPTPTFHALIDRETFERVQTALDVRSKVKQRHRRTASKHLLTGLLRCPGCGRNMRGGHQDRRSTGTVYVRYACGGKEYGACGRYTALAPGTETEVLRQLVAYLDDATFRKRLERAARGRTNADLAKLLADLDGRRAKLKQLKRMLVDDAIDEDEYVEMAAEVKADIDALEAQSQTVAESLPLHLVGKGEEIALAWEEFTFDERRATLADVIEYVELRPHSADVPANRFDPSRVTVHFRW